MEDLIARPVLEIRFGDGWCWRVMQLLVHCKYGLSLARELGCSIPLQVATVMAIMVNLTQLVFGNTGARARPLQDCMAGAGKSGIN